MHKQAHPEKLHEYAYTLILPDNFLTFCSSFISVTRLKCPDKTQLWGRKRVTSQGTLSVVHITSTVKNTEKNGCVYV